MAREVIALAGVGNLGKYLCEELLSSSIYSVIVISRNVCHELFTHLVTKSFEKLTILF